MPRLPKNLIRRRGRPGYYFRKMEGGRRITRFLDNDYHEACRKLREFSQGDLPLQDMPLREAAAKWLTLHVGTVRTGRTRPITRRRVEMYILPQLGHLLLQRLRSEQLQAFRVYLDSCPIKPRTVCLILSDLRCLLAWCVDAGLLLRSPFPRRLLPKVQEVPPDRLQSEEVDRLLCIPEPYGFIVRLGLSTGLRWGEMVRAEAQHLEGGLLVVSRTKTGKVRRVPVPPELQAEIRSHIGKLLPYRERSAGGFNRMARKHSGVARFHVHQLRHTFACRWIEHGGSLAALQEILGHSTIVTTQRYARLSHREVEREAHRVYMATKVATEELTQKVK